jgi:hypothetical protein
MHGFPPWRLIDVLKSIKNHEQILAHQLKIERSAECLRAEVGDLPARVIDITRSAAAFPRVPIRLLSFLTWRTHRHILTQAGSA